jgi:Uma2 family endonuclease
LLPNGIVITECPLSTSDGVKATDVAWLAPHRVSESEGVLLTQAPEICVEILSPSNSRKAIEEKITLYFDAGAKEVWICNTMGTMSFRTCSDPKMILSKSEICPDFPESV